MTTEGELVEVADGIVAWIADPGGFGASNSAAVIEDDGITVVDARTVPSHAAPFAEALGELGVPIRRLVLTSNHRSHASISRMIAPTMSVRRPSKFKLFIVSLSSNIH